MTRGIFETYVETQLAPTLSKGDVVSSDKMCDSFRHLVKPYVRRGAKNDAWDAAAFCEAVSRLACDPFRSSQSRIRPFAKQHPSCVASKKEDHQRLQFSGCRSFPDDWVFFGSTQSQKRQIANALPPVMARVVGMAIYSALPGIEFDYARALASPLPDKHPTSLNLGMITRVMAQMGLQDSEV